jgi:hypothetical protein
MRQAQLGSFETGAMTSTANLTALADLSGRWLDRTQARLHVLSPAVRVQPGR